MAAGESWIWQGFYIQFSVLPNTWNGFRPLSMTCFVISGPTHFDESDCNNALGRVPMANKFNIGMDADIFTACSNSLTIGGFHQRNPRALSLAYATAGYLNHYRFTSQF